MSSYVIVCHHLSHLKTKCLVHFWSEGYVRDKPEKKFDISCQCHCKEIHYGLQCFNSEWNVGFSEMPVFCLCCLVESDRSGSVQYFAESVSAKHLLNCLDLASPELWVKHQVINFNNFMSQMQRQHNSQYHHMLAKVTAASQIDITESRVFMCCNRVVVILVHQLELSYQVTKPQLGNLVSWPATLVKNSEVLHSDTFTLTNSYFITMFHSSNEPSESPCRAIYRSSRKGVPFFRLCLPRLPSAVLEALLWAVLPHLRIHPMGITSFGKGTLWEISGCLTLSWFVCKTTKFLS